jgi:hypothetical protein
VSAAGSNIAEVVTTLSRLAGIQDDIVRIGGQAIAYWAEKYQSVCPTEFTSVNSPNIDFCGTADAVVECALKLNGTSKLASAFGLDERKVRKLAIAATVSDHDNDRPPTLLVMRPVHCLESRVYNVAGLSRSHREALNPNPGLEKLTRMVGVIVESPREDDVATCYPHKYEWQ